MFKCLHDRQTIIKYMIRNTIHWYSITIFKYDFLEIRQMFEVCNDQMKDFFVPSWVSF